MNKSLLIALTISIFGSIAFARNVSFSCVDNEGMMYMIQSSEQKTSITVVKAPPTAPILKNTPLHTTYNGGARGEVRRGEILATGFDQNRGFFFPIAKNGIGGIYLNFLSHPNQISGKNENMRVLDASALPDAIGDYRGPVTMLSVYADKVDPGLNEIQMGSLGACFQVWSSK